MKYLKLSIITPSLNMGRYLENCIRGVLWQDYPAVEHLVIDGGSKDETIGILEKYQHLKWISEPDKGLSDALNKGTRLATGDVIGWCCADDYYLPGAFKVAMRYLEENPSIMVIYGDYRNVNAEGVPLRIKREINYDLFILKYLHNNYIATPAAFWRRILHEKGFWFNEGLHFGMDTDFLLRVALAGYRFHHIPTLLADFRIHSKTKSSNQKQQLEHEWIIREHSPLLRNSPRQIASMLRMMLLLFARTKRTLIRAARGHYIEQYFRS
jgi:glycosyltransferase involved in cell wall biosynthesis